MDLSIGERIALFRTVTEGSMKTVLIADNDLGFVFWLGRALGASGYQSLPAKNMTHAAQWARQNVVSLLIVSPEMPGAADFVRMLRRSQGHLTVISLRGDGIAPQLEGVLASASRPERLDDASLRYWLDLVRTAVASDVRADAPKTVAGTVQLGPLQTTTHRPRVTFAAPIPNLVSGYL